MLRSLELIGNNQALYLQQRGIVHHAYSFSDDVARSLIDSEPVVEGLHKLSANLFSWHRCNIIVRLLDDLQSFQYSK